MATLVLGTVGRAIGGPIGGIVGTLVGSVVDHAVFGGSRSPGRLADLSVQSAAYGQPLPRVYGRMRVAGNLVWTAGIVETQQRTGSVKTGTATNSTNYSASFAVIVAGRPIAGIGRIWADGKLLRAIDGTFNFPATIRTYLGTETQAVDPLIASAEGVASTPAYRGRGVVVFDGLPLADYGNRIPNLTFEVIADPGPVGVDVIAADLSSGLVSAAAAAQFPSMLGYAAAQAGTIRQALATLGSATDLCLHDDGATLRIGTGASAAPVPAIDAGASDAAKPGAQIDETRGDDTLVADALWLSFSDVDRDYQTGIQAATRRTPALRIDQRDLTAAATAPDIKALAARLLREGIAARTTAKLALPWRYAAVRPGDTILLGDDTLPWRVTQRTITGAVIDVELDRVSVAAVAAFVADPGRAYLADDVPQGPTTLAVLDIPALPGAIPTQPQLLLAAGGAGGWRRADILVSRDGGASYVLAQSIVGAAVMGSTIDALGSGSTASWDRRSTVDVALLADEDDLQSASEDSVLSGSNLAVIGDELVQFADATLIAPRTYRLSTLLRGRRGSEAAVTSHGPGELFVLLDSRIVTLGLPLEALGSVLMIKAVGPGEDAATVAAQAVTVGAVDLRPLSPVFVTTSTGPSGDVVVSWIRRSRGGFVWLDGTDVPLAEDREAYRITITVGTTTVRTVDVAAPTWTYAAADHASDASAGRALAITVAQVSPSYGPGDPATVTLS